MLQRLLEALSFPDLCDLERVIKAEIRHRMILDEDACVKSLERHKAATTLLQVPVTQETQAGS